MTCKNRVKSMTKVTELELVLAGKLKNNNWLCKLLYTLSSLTPNYFMSFLHVMKIMFVVFLTKQHNIWAVSSTLLASCPANLPTRVKTQVLKLKWYPCGATVKPPSN